jgi:hypothetical protein
MKYRADLNRKEKGSFRRLLENARSNNNNNSVTVNKEPVDEEQAKKIGM